MQGLTHAQAGTTNEQVRQMLGMFPLLELLSITLAGTSGQGYQVVSCFQGGVSSRKRVGFQ